MRGSELIGKNAKVRSWSLSPFDFGKLSSGFDEGTLFSRAVCLESERPIAISAMQHSIQSLIEEKITALQKLQESVDTVLAPSGLAAPSIKTSANKMR